MKNLKRALKNWGWSFAGLSVVLPLWGAFRIRSGFPYDDAFITFTYARNVAAGHGFVYNGGTPFLGTTSPLLTITLALLSRAIPHVEIYTIALWLGAGLWAASAVVAYLLGRRLAGDLGGAAMAVAHVIGGVYLYILPSEYPMLIFLSLLSIYLAMGGREWIGGLVVGLAFLARGDAAILALLLGVVLLWEKRRVPWGFVLAFAAVISPWMVYGTIQFGNPLPSTLKIKRAHMALGAWPPLYVGFFRWVRKSGKNLWVWLELTTAMSAFALILAFIRRNLWAALLILWGAAYAVAYVLIGVPFYFWYSIPTLEALALGTGMALGLSWGGGIENKQEASGYLRGNAVRAAMTGIAFFALAYVLIMGYSGMSGAKNRLSRVSSKTEAYIATAKWLRDHTPEESTVGFIEVGLLGYFSHRQVIDLLGLTTPGMEKFLLKRDHVGILRAYHPDYYVRNSNFDGWGMNRAIHESTYFKEHYELVTTIPQRKAKPILVYQRKHG